jgi:hypothetical protein
VQGPEFKFQYHKKEGRKEGKREEGRKKDCLGHNKKLESANQLSLLPTSSSLQGGF